MQSLTKKAIENSEENDIIKFVGDQCLAVLFSFLFCGFWIKFGTDHNVTCSAR